MTVNIDNAIEIDHNVGVDVDLIGGYDFGGFRAELELGYKSASLDEALILSASDRRQVSSVAMLTVTPASCRP